MTPKILVVSNNCLSRNDSNGRSLGNLLIEWPKKCLAQFYLQNAVPDFYYCDNFFRVTDQQALQAFIGKKCTGGIIKRVCVEKNDTPSIETTKKRPRNAVTMLAREIVWSSNKWRRCGFDRWVQKFSPDVILLQAGDNAFMFRFAAELADRYHAKLMIYNTEAYYYKDYDYFNDGIVSKLFYPFFHKNFQRALKESYHRASQVIYCCEELENAYKKDFKTKSMTIYTSTQVECARTDYTDNSGKHMRISYCGNLGIERDVSLTHVADVLQTINPDLYVDVYGKVPSHEVEERLTKCRGIRFHGLVPYEEVQKINQESDILLHVESFSEFYQKDIRFGFSTKVADSLASGKCFLVYAPEIFACVQYLKKNEAAYTASDDEQLRKILEELVREPKSRKRYLKKAKMLAEENHNLANNSEKFKHAVSSVME